MSTRQWAALGLFLMAATTPNVASAKDTVRAPGAETFKSFGCAACHGTTGAGGGWQGPKLAPGPLPYEAFVAQLREPAGKMPRYSERALPEATVSQIYEYLKTVQPGPRGADIPMLNRP